MHTDYRQRHVTKSLSRDSSEIFDNCFLETADLGEASEILHRFDALSLGEGNLNAGMNTLTAMALTLANIAPPGSHLLDQNTGTRVTVGMNLLVHGALSGSLINEQVLTPLETLQNNLFDHIRQHVERLEQKKKRPVFNPAFKNSHETVWPTALELVEEFAESNDVDFEQELRKLLNPLVCTNASKVSHYPAMFAGIGSAETLDTVIGFANSGRLYAHVHLASEKSVRLLNHAFEELVSRCPKRSRLSASVSGEVIATAPAGMLESLLAENGGHNWLGHMLWLVEHSAGPETEIAASTADAPKLSQVGKLYTLALRELMTQRLNCKNPSTEIVPVSFSRHQATWNAFLTQLEPRTPGITHALRPLWASLLFGLMKIFALAQNPSGIKVSLNQIDAYARLLALRMVNARAVITNENRRNLIEKVAASIRHKLLDGPHTVRELMRRSNNTDAATIRYALLRLADSGVVVFRDKSWQLADS